MPCSLKWPLPVTHIPRVSVLSSGMRRCGGVYISTCQVFTVYLTGKVNNMTVNLLHSEDLGSLLWLLSNSVVKSFWFYEAQRWNKGNKVWPVRRLGRSDTWSYYCNLGSAAGGVVVRELEIGVSKGPGPVLFARLSGPLSRSDSPWEAEA